MCCDKINVQYVLNFLNAGYKKVSKHLLFFSNKVYSTCVFGFVVVLLYFVEEVRKRNASYFVYKAMTLQSYV